MKHLLHHLFLSTVILFIPTFLLSETVAESDAEILKPISATDQILELSSKTPKGTLFIYKEAIPVLSLSAGGFAEEPTFAETFDSGWERKPKSWAIATWNQNKTKMSKDRAKTNEEGELILTVKAGEPYRGGSIQSKQEFGYGRWIARVRPSSVPGLLNSIFTKDWDDHTTSETPNDGKKAEVDIEFVTHTFGEGKGEIHL
jgi:hypothetical protein